MMRKKSNKKAKAAFANAARAIIRVGKGGRGFVIEEPRLNGAVRYVITAAHCLPHLPPAHPASYDQERTYANLLGPLKRKPRVWTECLFVDPVNDIAVLGSPDNQKFIEESEGYEQLVDGCTALDIVAPVTGESQYWTMTLDGQWMERTLGCNGGRLWLITGAAVESGMSGSPIINGDGDAVALCSTGNSETDLAGSLPGRFLRIVLSQLGKRHRAERKARQGIRPPSSDRALYLYGSARSGTCLPALKLKKPA